MMRLVNNIFTIIVLLLAFGVRGQEDLFANKSRFIQKNNPSYFGFNSLNKIGVLYNSLSISDSNKSDNKYLFSSISMDNQNFSLGFEINSFKLQTTGLTINKGRAVFVYKLKLDNNLYLLPSFSLGFTNSSTSINNLIFGDQINIFTGAIISDSSDPLSQNIASLNYLDVGASFIIHDDEFLAGLSLKQLNTPNVSLDEGQANKLPILISLQGGYELDINPYQNGILPESSFLFLYTTISLFNGTMQGTLSEDVQLGSFSFGLAQNFVRADSFGLSSFGFSVGTAFDNFDIGFQINSPLNQPNKLLTPSIFELHVVFNFSQYRRNNRGRFKRLNVDNYYE